VARLEPSDRAVCLKVKLNEDILATSLVFKAPSDPEAAAGALRIAARYIRSEQPLPRALGIWIAKAFERAAKTPQVRRPKVLTDALHLTANHRRPKASWLLAGAAFDSLIEEGRNPDAVAIQIAEDFEIDKRTARRYWSQYQKAKDAHDSIR